MANNLMLCTTCGNTGTPKTVVHGSLAAEIILWVFLLIPGLIYSIWRLTSKEKVCPKCGRPNMIPLDSPIARKMVYDQAKAMQQKRQEFAEDPVDKWEREQAR